jgi:hypothetical protein
MIIETSANRFYQVTETNIPELAHCWYGFELRRKVGEYIIKRPGERAELVRKAATRVVEA